MENMNNMEVYEPETDVTEVTEYETETYTDEKGISGKDVATIAIGTLIGVGVVKWIGKKVKPLIVKGAVKMAKKNGYTCVPNEVLDAAVEDTEQVEVEEEE
jgi:hypothetical protein